MFEKKNGKRFLASVMALVMLLSLAPVGALAVEDEGQNQDVVALPADGDNPKPVVTDEENTENTNEELTSPPSNKGDKIILTDNNNTSTAISKAEIIPEEKMFDEAFSVNPNTSNSNDIAEHKGGNKGDREPVTTDSTTKYVIRFYVSNTGTKDYYGESNKYGIAGQPNSTIDGAEGGDTVTIMVSPDYAILTQCNDVAKGISTEKFKAVEVTGDTDVRAWLIKYAEKKVPDELTDRNNVNAIVNFVNTQYNNSGKNLPTLNANDFNGFRFVDAHYVNSGECSIHVHVQLIKENQYIVQYNPNGGSGAMVDENLYFPGDQATVKANEFTRTGYTFDRWNTKTDGTGTNYALDEKVTIGNKNVTLYAQWTANTHKVTYIDGENGTVFSNVEKTGTYGEDIPKYNNENTDPTREGYKFKGWTSSVSGITPASVMPDRDVTFTATWEKEQTTEPENPTSEINAKYFVLMPSKGKPTSGQNQGPRNYFPNIRDNGGVVGSTILTGYRGKISTSIIQDHPEANTKNGYFVANGVDSKYLVVPSDLGYFSEGYTGNFPSVLGNNFTMTGKEIIWYVVKNVVTDLTPSYHVDGYLAGIPVELRYHENFNFISGIDDTIDTVNKNGENDLCSGDTVTISGIDETTTAKHPGWTFVGWTENRDGSGTVYNAGNTKVMMDSCDLYAKWKKEDSPKQSYTLTVNYIYENGNEVQRPHVEQVEEGRTYTVTSPLIVGYTSDQTVVNGTMPNHDVNVNVKYKANEYTVTYYVNGQLWNADAQKYTVGQSVNVRPDFPKEGYQFSGWSSTDVEIENRAFTMPAKDVIINGSYTKVLNPDPLTYTINQHFMNAKGSERTDLAHSDKDQSANKDAVLNGLITGLAKDLTKDGSKYMYVPGKTTYTVGTGENTKTENLGATATLTEDTTIDLYYYLDNWKDAGNTTDKDSETDGDGIPDCDQVLIKYASSNSERGTVSPDMEVLTLRKDNENVQIKINGSKATDNGGRNYFSNWTDTTGKQVSTNATLNNETIQKVIKEFTGGETYTFTANFERSSGGGSGGSNRPKPPVVEIPDDVPTGLNGKDHYAYIIGYGNNDVRPQNNITRAEVATIFFRLLTDETREANMTKSNGYNDVKDGDWFCCAVSTLSKMGIIKGYEDGSFKPNDPISRAEFAAIAARFDPDGDKTPASFSDVTSHWAKDEISIAANHGWIKGYEDGSFKPDQKITRAETMTLVNRVLNRLPEAKDDLHKDMKTWVDNMDETAWYYLAVQEATNSHYFKNKTGTKFEQWTDLRDTRDWSELEK